MEVLAAAKHQVFEKMSESGFSGLFVLRTHVIPDVYRNYGRLVVRVNDNLQAIVQRELFVGDFEI